jgi:hypothetical protein
MPKKVTELTVETIKDAFDILNDIKHADPFAQVSYVKRCAETPHEIIKILIEDNINANE